MRVAVVIVVCIVTAACAQPAPADVVVRLASGDCRNDEACAFDFGAIASQSVVAFDVANVGGTSAAVGAGVTNGLDAPFELAQAPATPLGPGGTAPFAIVAGRPAPGATTTAILRVQWLEGVDVLPTRSNSPLNTPRVITVNLSATGGGDDATCPRLDGCSIGDKPVGSDGECGIALHNDSDVAQTVDDVEIVGDGFTIGGVVVLPLIVEPFLTVRLTVHGTPSTAGEHAANVSIRCDTVVVSSTVTVNGT